MSLGRLEKAGEAMVVFSVDSQVEPATLAKVGAAVEARFIKAVRLGVK